MVRVNHVVNEACERDAHRRMISGSARRSLEIYDLAYAPAGPEVAVRRSLIGTRPSDHDHFDRPRLNRHSPSMHTNWVESSWAALARAGILGHLPQDVSKASASLRPEIRRQTKRAVPETQSIWSSSCFGT